MTKGTNKSWGTNATVRAWGNSAAVRIPSAVLKQALLYRDSPVTIHSPEPGVIIIESAERSASSRR